MRYLLAVVAAILLNPFFSRFSYAHPGNTASDGCHYCRTNCAKWGVPQDERHCHNAVSAPAPDSVKN